MKCGTIAKLKRTAVAAGLRIARRGVKMETRRPASLLFRGEDGSGLDQRINSRGGEKL